MAPKNVNSADSTKSAKAPNAGVGPGINARAIGKVAERQAYALWLYDPNRTPRTQKDWARANGVAPATLSDWKRTAPEVLEAAKAIKGSPAISIGFAEATRRMVEEAKLGKVNAYRALSDVLGMNAPFETKNVTDLATFLSGVTAPEPVELHEISGELREISGGRRSA